MSTVESTVTTTFLPPWRLFLDLTVKCSGVTKKQEPDVNGRSFEMPTYESHGHVLLLQHPSDFIWIQSNVWRRITDSQIRPHYIVMSFLSGDLQLWKWSRSKTQDCFFIYTVLLLRAECQTPAMLLLLNTSTTRNIIQSQTVTISKQYDVIDGIRKQTDSWM